MKKKMAFMLMACLLCACSKNSQTYFYLTSNQEDIANVLITNHPMPAYNYTFPFEEDITEIANLSDQIEAIYPYYPLKIFPSNDTGYEWSAKIDGSTKTVAFNKDFGRGMEISTLNVFSLPEREYYQKRTEVITHFDSQSGIFISEYLYSLLQLEKDPSSLILELTIQVPVSMHYGPVDIEYQPYIDQDDYSLVEETWTLNEIDAYAPVKMELEIEGVTSKNSSLPSAYNIGIPYELAQQIYDTAQSDHIQIKEGSMPWQPNTYTAVFAGDIDINQCVEILDQYLSNYFVYRVRYDYNTIEAYQLSE